MEEKKDDGWQAFWVITAFGIIIYMLIGGIARCAGSDYDPVFDGSPWSPRHTELQKMHKNTQEMHIFS